MALMIAESGDAKEKPPLPGVLTGCRALGPAASALMLAADHFDFHAAVLRAAFAGLVAGNGLALALALDEDTIGRQAFRDEEGFHGICTAQRELDVVRVSADRIGVTGCDHDFDIRSLQLRDQIRQLGLARRLEHRFVEIEEGIGFERDLFCGEGAAAAAGAEDAVTGAAGSTYGVGSPAGSGVTS